MENPRNSIDTEVAGDISQVDHNPLLPEVGQGLNISEFEIMKGQEEDLTGVNNTENKALLEEQELSGIMDNGPLEDAKNAASPV